VISLGNGSILSSLKMGELSQYSFLKVMKNLLFHLKAVKTGTHKAQVGASAGAGVETFWKSKTRAGAGKK
jgi:hypothetical protein